MAARQDQNLQIWLIVFVCLTVLFFGMAAWMYSSNNAAQTQVAALEKERNDAQNALNTKQSENEFYLTKMGLGQFDDQETVQKQFDEDLKQYKAYARQEEPTYRSLLSSLHEYAQTNEQQIAAATQREKSLQASLVSLEQEKEAQIKKIQEEKQKVEAAAAEQSNSFKQFRAQIAQEQQKLQDDLAQQKQKYADDVAAARQETATVNSELQKAHDAVADLTTEVEQQRPSNAVADGQITYVNQATGTVWINLGSADSLQRQVTFSVFGSDMTDAARSDKKGAIEVTRILSDNMAEARITDDSAQAPIVRGDNVYSPVWHRGKQVRFALAGDVDLTGDGNSDIELAKDLIKLNGGAVDAWVSNQGKIEGELSVRTRYLVLGEYPESPAKGAQREAWNELSRQADLSGVETITLNEFQDQMGYRPENRTVGVGKNAPTGDSNDPSRFRARTPYMNR